MNVDTDIINAPFLIWSCRRCVRNPDKVFGQNALTEMGYCPHQRIGIVRTRGWGCWYVLRNATPVEFADLAMTVAMFNAANPDFWTLLIARGSEGMK